ncbi:MAG: hypothetical protein KKB90_09785 [Actinobacteria bacterium]|nr:hypothetical protein [Actinomycetota bacterium]MCG2818815.1 hypothetical protein [Actinomycetes bacterium]MBU4219234.1 hypothetical protein [Actinomycetota bacterium]MBU4359491.1 hypothetical protein [Actinomycetota bacterium]MBU4392881.1 hypothetical protein [Actinomycetota bacterium]
MKKSKYERAKKVGWISYISKIPKGIEADAVLLGVTDTGNRAGWDPQYEFVMEIRFEENDSFETRFRRIIPAGLVPNFQLGRTFRVLFDPKDRSQVSFLSFTTENNETIDFRCFPVRLKHMEDTEMKPDRINNEG